MRRRNKNKKRKLARSMMTPAEVKKNISPYSSFAWLMRVGSRKEKEKAKRTKV